MPANPIYSRVLGRRPKCPVKGPLEGTVRIVGVATAAVLFATPATAQWETLRVVDDFTDEAPSLSGDLWRRRHETEFKAR